MPKTVTADDIVAYRNLRRPAEDLIIRPGDLVSAETVSLFRQYQWQYVSKLIVPQPKKKELRKPYRIDVRCSHCDCHIDNVEMVTKYEIEQYLYYGVSGYINSNGEFVRNIPKKEGYLVSVPVKVGDICYVPLTIPVLCEKCRQTYLEEIYLKEKEKMDDLESAIHSGDETMYNRYKDIFMLSV